MRYILLLILCLSYTCYADVFSSDTSYKVCFTPQENCTAELVDLIDSAQHTVHLQAFSFTSWDIANALVRADKRGIKVLVLFDKSLFKAPYNKKTKFLQHNGINIRLDPADNIAHNKVIIIDDTAVETGSFNYTYSAQHYNAENTLIIYSKKLASQYLANWHRRWDLAAS
jgi:phospholipase D